MLLAGFLLTSLHRERKSSRGFAVRKYFLITCCLVVLVLGLATTASALIYTNTQNPDLWLTGTGTYSWTHPVTTDFQIPYDTLNSATLTIGAWSVSDSNDRVYVEGTYAGDLANGVWYLLGYSSTVLDIGSVFTTWTSGEALNVSLAYNEGRWGSLYLSSSTLRIDYNNGTASVPEPGTMLLMGLGLVGVGVIRRKMKIQ